MRNVNGYDAVRAPVFSPNDGLCWNFGPFFCDDVCELSACDAMIVTLICASIIFLLICLTFYYLGWIYKGWWNT